MAKTLWCFRDLEPRSSTTSILTSSFLDVHGVEHHVRESLIMMISGLCILLAGEDCVYGRASVVSRERFSAEGVSDC